MSNPFRSGFVSLVGRPNAGKSTLLNTLLGTKLAIVADKPQTTRNAIQGVLTEAEAQVIFLDTPGIHEANSLLHKRMNDKIKEALDGRDLILFIVDAARPISKSDAQALQWVQTISTKVILVLNKVDALPRKTDLFPLIEHYQPLHDFSAIIPISALSGDGIDILKKEIVARLPEGPRYFPDDYITDQPERFLVAELIREKILHFTEQEVPHSVAVMVDKWEEQPRPKGTLTRIMATIHVERDGQKAIILGAGGAMLKKIGAAARLDIERLYDRRVYLELFVRVTPGWRDRAQFLNELEQSSVSTTE